ncbi:MAG: tetratricopeptide repeat protein [Desulfobacterales bacterium]
MDLTFALNYKFGKLNVFGYHLVNVLVHIINGFLVYLLVFAILKQRPELTDSYDLSISESPDFLIRELSLCAAMIFVVHPIQTQAVTYIVQRYASMAAMFYIGSILFYICARTLQRRPTDKASNKLHLSGLYALSIACGMLAFLSKQNTATLPAVILLAEYLLINGTWNEWKKKLPWFVLLFICWLLFVLFVLNLFNLSGGEFGHGNLLEDVSALTKETVKVSRWHYLCTQFNVLVIYIRLLFIPLKQSLDYMYPFKTGIFDGLTPLAFMFLIAIAGFGIWSIKRRPVITFSIFFFFITLSIESSIIPIRDALFEHRLYLPMFGFGFLVSSQLFHYLSKKRSLALVLLLSITVYYGTATYLRNITWQDEATLWSDVVSKNPRNHRAHYNLGLTLNERGRIEEAIQHYLQALRIKPDYVRAHNNLGLALVRKGNIRGAMARFREALRIDPNDEKTHNNLGNALDNQGRTEEAIQHYLQALRINPDDENAHNNLGNALDNQGRTEEAIQHYLQALRINPDFMDAHNNMAIALVRKGNIEGAIARFKAALRINPDHIQAKNNLNRLLMMQQRNK